MPAHSLQPAADVERYNTADDDNFTQVRGQYCH